MNSYTALIVSLLEVASPAESDAVVRIPPEDMLADLFAGLASDEISAQFAQILQRARIGEIALGEALESLRTILQFVGQQPARAAALQARIDSFRSLLRQLASVEAVLASDLVRGAALHVRQLQLFRFVQQLSFPLLDGLPQTLFVGRAPRSQEQLTISLKRGYLLDKIALAYTNLMPWPLLSVQAASLADVEPWMPTRTLWPQEASPQHALRIFNARSAEIGSISSDLLALPVQLDHGPFSVALSADPGIAIVRTIISDAEGSALLRCLRVVPAASIAS